MHCKYLLTGAALLLAAPSLAQEGGPEEVDEVVVTASRLAAPADETPGARVVGPDEIDLVQAVTAADVLETVPGLSLSRNGGFGGVTSVRMRGASSDKTLVLIDGVPVNDPSTPAGGFDFASLDIADVERIEVLSGPQGSLWGSDAIGGVIDIRTREPDGVRGLLEAGYFETGRAALGVGEAGEAGAFGVSLAGFTSAGVSKADEDDGNTERDAFENVTVSVNARRRVSPSLELEARARYNQADVEYDSFGLPTGVVDGPETSRAETWSGFLRGRLDGPWGVRHRLSLEGFTTERRNEGTFSFGAEGDRVALRWLAERRWSRHSALVGVEREETRADSGLGAETSDANAAFAIWRFEPLRGAILTASLRRDDPDRYEGETTARLAGSAELPAGFRVAASFGQGFKTPSIFQSTYACFECPPGTPRPVLKPERAEGWDLTLSWEAPDGRADASITAYRLRVSDQIDYAFPFGYANIDATRTNGLELEGRADLTGGLQARASYAWTDAEDRTTGARLLKIPEHAGSASLQWTGSRADGAFILRAESDQIDVFGRIDDFVVADLSGSWALHDDIHLTGRIENVFAANYQEAFGYGEPGRAIYLGLRLRQ